MAKRRYNEVEMVDTSDIDWSIFLQDGVVVYLSIKRYRGTSTFDFAEIGLDSTGSTPFQEFMGNYIKPGTKKLIPPEIDGQLKSIESQARQNLKDLSFDCPITPGGKFVPLSAYKDFIETDKQLKTKFYAIRNSFFDHYDDMVDKVKDDYRILAENVWRSTHGDSSSTSTPTSANSATAPESTLFIESFISSIASQIPSREEIYDSFDYKTSLRRIPEYALSALASPKTEDNKPLASATSSVPATSSTSSSKRAVKPFVTAPDRQPLTAAKASTTAATTVAVLPSTKADSFDDLRAEVERDVNESINSQSVDLIGEFTEAVRTQLYETAFKGSSDVARSMDKNNGKLVGRASMKAHSLVDLLKKMDFYGEASLQSAVKALEDALGADDDTKGRDLVAVRAALQKMHELSSVANGVAIEITLPPDSSPSTTPKGEPTVKSVGQRSGARRRSGGASGSPSGSPTRSPTRGPSAKAEDGARTTRVTKSASGTATSSATKRKTERGAKPAAGKTGTEASDSGGAGSGGAKSTGASGSGRSASGGGLGKRAKAPEMELKTEIELPTQSPRRTRSVKNKRR